MNPDPRRALPKVDLLLAHPELAGRVRRLGREPVLGVVRRVLESSRRDLAAGGQVPELAELAAQVAGELDAAAGRRTRAVLNATGVVLHTNLGRAPLSEAARVAVMEAAGYATVEYNLAAGRRGRRGAAAEALLREATGASAALIANNAAGALLLALGCLARGREVVVSRGELIEIGGEFRLPAIMEAAGVTLVEVGTTNRTHLHDYAQALSGASGAVLAVHPSNYRVEGFTTSPELAALAALAHEHGLPLLHDLGSGLLGGPLGGQLGGPLGAEPTVAGSLAAGADLVVFSGDKLLGGPQAGLVVGHANLVGRLARHPVARAVRADKLTIAALEATLAAHLAGRRDELPVWRALLLSPADLRPRAAELGSRPQRRRQRRCPRAAALAAALGPAAQLRCPRAQVRRAEQQGTPHGQLVAPPGEVGGQGRLKRGDGELVGTHRPGDRMPGEPPDQVRMPHHQPGLGPAEQLVTREHHQVGPGGQAASDRRFRPKWTPKLAA